MRPPRSLPAVLGLTALLALPAMAEAKTAVRQVGFQAKVVSINKSAKSIRARVLIARGAGLTQYKDKTLTFDLRKAKLSVTDTNGDGKTNTLSDIKANDIIGVNGTGPATGALKVVKTTTLTDVTALLQKPSLPTTPTTPGSTPSGAGSFFPSGGDNGGTAG